MIAVFFFCMLDRPKWIVDDMTEKLAKIQAEVKYSQIIKIQKMFKTMVTLPLQEVKINVKSAYAKLTMLKVCLPGQAKRKPIE